MNEELKKEYTEKVKEFFARESIVQTQGGEEVDPDNTPCECCGKDSVGESGPYYRVEGWCTETEQRLDYTVCQACYEYAWKEPVDLSGADLRRANLTEANFSNANLSEADLSGADLSGADLSGADLSGADLSGANLRRANLVNANLYRTNLSEADLTEAGLSRADLTGAALSGANLRRANLTDANLFDADLSDANLRRANLTDANLTDANLRGAKGDGHQIISIQSKWDIAFTATQLAIGCEQHSWDEWKAFTDEEINNMHREALDWWKIWKSILFSARNALVDN